MEKDQTMLVYIPIVVLILITVKGLASFGQDYSIEYVGQQVIMRLRDEIYRHIQSLSMNFFAHIQSGTLVSRITNDVNLLQTAAASLIAEAIRHVVTSVRLINRHFLPSLETRIHFTAHSTPRCHACRVFWPQNSEK